MAIKKPGSAPEPTSEYSEGARVSKKIKDRLDYQIKVEAEAAQIYRAMAQWCDFNGYFNASKFMSGHAVEEMAHMKRVMNYSLDRNCMPTTPAMVKPAQEFEDLIDIIRKSYKHEKFVTDTYQEFAGLCLAEGDYVTFTWLQWYLKEQVEEEKSFSNMLDKIEMMKKEGVGMLEIETEISSSSLIGCDNC